MIMPYANADAYLGNKVGRFHRRTWWYAKGTPHDQFEAIIAKIKTQVEAAIDDYYGFFHFQLFMIGRDEASAKPTIMFFCEKKKVREKAKEAVNSGGLMQKLPGFRTGHAPTQPDIGSLVQCATEDNATASSGASIIHEEVYSDSSSGITALGMPIYVKYQNGQRRQATAYTVFQGARCMLMTVAHVFIEREPVSNEVVASENDDYDFGDGTESEEEDKEQTEMTSRGSVSSRGRDSSEDLSIRTSKGPGLPDQTNLPNSVNPETEASRDSFSPTLSTQSDSAGKSSMRASTVVDNLRRLGTVVTSSIEDDWALIEITDPGASDNISLQRLAGEHLNIFFDPYRSIVVFDIDRSPIYGSLSQNKGYIRLPGSSTFQEFLILQLDGEIDWGDCGALVFNCVTLRPCGHIVASSSTKHIAVVVPAHRVFQSSNTTWIESPVALAEESNQAFVTSTHSLSGRPKSNIGETEAGDRSVRIDIRNSSSVAQSHGHHDETAGGDTWMCMTCGAENVHWVDQCPMCGSQINIEKA
jgi:hypothetical protein